MSDYFYSKSKFYYEKYKAGKLTRKVGAIIKDGNKYSTFYSGWIGAVIGFDELVFLTLMNI